MGGKDDRVKVEQIVGECFLKAANIVLSSRIEEPHKSDTAAQLSKRKWFNLEVEEVESAQAGIAAWRKSFSSPLVIEIREAPTDQEISSSQSPAECSQGKGRVLERWIFGWHVETRGTKSTSSRLEPAAIYKRMVIMLRSLYTYTRILPTYKVFKSRKHGSGHENRLFYHIAEKMKAGSSRRDSGSQEGMAQYNFSAIETPFGFFKMQVGYLPASQLGAQEPTQHQEALPNVIPDYIGRRRSSLSESLTTSPDQAAVSPPQLGHAASPLGPQVKRATTMQAEPSGEALGGMQASSPFIRRHSWSLQSARSQDATAGKAASPSQTGQRPLTLHPHAQSRTTRMGSTPPAPGTPLGSSATPPKYPSQGFATRMSQAAMSAASKMYAYSQGSSTPFSRSPLHASSRTTPQRFDERDMRRMSRQMSSSNQTPETLESGTQPVSQHCTSKPVGIPGSQGSARRLRSSDDLRVLGNGNEAPGRVSTSKKVMSSKHAVSAPAAQVHFGFTPKPKAKQATDKPMASPFATISPSGKEQTYNPGTPPALYGIPSLGSESTSSVYSTLMTSGSPQLPFACTPSSHSFTDQMRKDSGAANTAGAGQDPSAGTRGATPPQWSTRSSGLDNSSGTGPSHVGYSVSTMLDSIGSSLFSSSAQAYHLPYSLQSQSTSPRADALGLDARALSGSQHEPGRMLSTDKILQMMEDPDHESLPFALDQEIVSSALSTEPGEPERSFHKSGGAGGSEPDAAVGAFVQLIEDAPPLQRSIMPAQQPAIQRDSQESQEIVADNLAGPMASQEMTLQAGLDQLAKLRLHLSQQS